ncbi:PA1571 family protein [Pseudomonas wadenswilerensis]
MSLQHSSSTPQQRPTQPVPAHGSIIDAQGREVPITEEMIQHACQELEKSRDKAAKKG